MCPRRAGVPFLERKGTEKNFNRKTAFCSWASMNGVPVYENRAELLVQLRAVLLFLNFSIINGVFQKNIDDFIS